MAITPTPWSAQACSIAARWGGVAARLTGNMSTSMTPLANRVEQSSAQVTAQANAARDALAAEVAGQSP